MSSFRALFQFLYDFVVGDDWVIAVGVVFALMGTHLLVQAGLNAWWLLPLSVVCLLAVSLRRLTRLRPK